MQFGLIEMWQAMGAVAKTVSILLIALSVISLYMLIERSLTFRKAKSKSKEVAPKLAEMLRTDRSKKRWRFPPSRNTKEAIWLE
jgi:biopolymer transport protein TolQ